MDRELSAILELPFITIMAAMIAIFCRFEMIMHEACRNSYLLLFEVKNGELQRILSLKQNLAAYPGRVPFFRPPFGSGKRPFETGHRFQITGQRNGRFLTMRNGRNQFRHTIYSVKNESVEKNNFFIRSK